MLKLLRRRPLLRVLVWIDRAGIADPLVVVNCHVQVQSFSVDPPSTGVDPGLRYHLAVNYWFHPPDVLTPAGVGRPYKDPYWEEHWTRVVAAMGLNVPAGPAGTAGATKKRGRT